jgi:lambda family phage portal protein
MAGSRSFKGVEFVNTLDRMIGYLSPSKGLARVRARNAIRLVNDYDGASRGRRTQRWTTTGSSANTETQRGLVHLRSRHRDLVRNNPWASRAVQAIVANTVGHGITGELIGANRGAAAAFLNWAESSACDADGLHDLYGMQAMVLRAVVESGDCLIRARVRRPEDGMDVPLQLQILEGDYLDHNKSEETKNGGRIIQGVQFNAIGQREGYWLYRNHPGDSLGMGTGSVFVPADRVAHIYRADRPGQVRGVPWGASVMMTLRDLDDYEDAYLLRQKLANCITGFVHDHSLDLTGAETNLPMPETLEPGLIAGLPAGKTITFNDPPRVDGYGAYTRDVLLRVAAGYGITFQALTGDLSSVNFSSGRMGWLEMHRNIEQWRWHMLIPQMLERVSGWWLEAAALGRVRVTGRERVEWTPPRREMIDPTKETKAATDAIRAGLTSLSAVHREFGVHTPRVLAEIAEGNAMADQLGLRLESDARHTNAARAVAPQGDDE